MTTTANDLTLVTDVELGALLTQLATVQAAKADLTTREEDLKARVRAALPDPNTYVVASAVGTVRVEVQRNRRFNPDAALPMLSDTDLAACTVSALDPKLVKARLTPMQLEDCMKTVGDHKIVLR